MAEKLLTVREVGQILQLSEKEVIDLAQNGEIPAYNVGGLYLRFKKDQIDLVKDKFLIKSNQKIHPYTLREKISDFLYFNDYYILSLVLIVLMVLFIFRQ